MTARGEEAVREAIRRTDLTLIVVSIVVWLSLAIFSVALVMYSGVAGGGILFIVYIVALTVWGKLLRDWLNERRELLRELVRGGKQDVNEEIRRLREAIEKLRESLES